MSGIAVFGEMLVDQFASGPVIGGAPFNVARHLAAFGLAPLMLGAVGADDNGTRLLAEMDRFGLARAGVQRTPRWPSGVVDVTLAADRSHQFHIREGCAWDHVALAPAMAAMASLDAGAWLYCGTLALRAATSRATELALMRGHGGPRFLDVNWREGHVPRAVAQEAIALAQVLKMNEDELAMLCGWYGVDASGTPADAARRLFSALRPRLLLVTLGEQGALAVDADGVSAGTPAARVDLVDTVGAGDSFSAVALAGLMRGWPLADTLARATQFAGHVCGIRGAVPERLASYAEWTASWPATK